jgi:ribulose 1,5-bisphosphate carboxylase large subunit-like protein
MKKRIEKIENIWENLENLSGGQEAFAINILAEKINELIEASNQQNEKKEDE